MHIRALCTQMLEVLRPWAGTVHLAASYSFAVQSYKKIYSQTPEPSGRGSRKEAAYGSGAAHAHRGSFGLVRGWVQRDSERSEGNAVRVEKAAEDLIELQAQHLNAYEQRLQRHDEHVAYGDDEHIKYT